MKDEEHVRGSFPKNERNLVLENETTTMCGKEHSTF